MKTIKFVVTMIRVNRIAKKLNTEDFETMKRILEFVAATKLSDDQIITEIKEMNA